MDSHKPYVSITGFTNAEEIETGLHAFKINHFSMDDSHVGSIGLAVNRTQPRVESRYVFDADVRELATLAHGRALRVLHFTPRFAQSTVESMRDADQIMGTACDGIQINGSIPPPELIARLRDLNVDRRIILPLDAAILAETQERIAERLARYKGLVHDVLIDPSGGQGIDLDLEQAAKATRAIRQALPHALPGFAGGFDGSNARQRVHLLRRLTGDRMNTDAEGKLRIDDRLDADRSNAYVAGVWEGFTQPL